MCCFFRSNPFYFDMPLFLSRFLNQRVLFWVWNKWREVEHAVKVWQVGNLGTEGYEKP